MAVVDSYYYSLNAAIEKIEEIYRIQEFARNGSDITAVIQSVNSQIKSVSREEIATRNLEAGQHVVLLSYLCFRLEFFQTSRMDFKQFIMLEEIERVLSLFTDRENYTSKNMRSVNRIIKIMSKMDEHSAKLRFGLAYRYLRLFIILIIYRSSCNSSIIANLLLQQINLQNRMEGEKFEKTN